MLLKVKGFRAGERVIVRPQRVDLPPGFNCLIGPSGLGKTTFLRLVLNEMEGQVAYLPQELTLPPYATPKDVALHIANINKCTIRSKFLIKFDQYVKLLGVDGLLNVKIGKLSAGEKERIAVALALARDCKLLLADEPGAHLDPMNAIKVLELVKHESDYSLVTLHNAIGFPFCDRFYTLKDGILVETTVEEALGVELKVDSSCVGLCFG